MHSQQPFCCWVSFYRMDKDGNRVTFSRKNKLRLAVVNLKVEVGLNSHKQATLYFEDGTHVGPFKYNQWNPTSKLAEIASNYQKWMYIQNKQREERDNG